MNHAYVHKPTVKSLDKLFSDCYPYFFSPRAFVTSHNENWMFNVKMKKRVLKTSDNQNPFK